MAAITWTQVTAFAPTLGGSTLSSTARDAILAWVNGKAIDVNAFDGEDGATTLLARVYLAAHAGTICRIGDAGAGGPIISRTAGGVSVTYATPAGGIVFDSLDSTQFGKMFRQLCKTSLGTGPFVLNGC